MSRRARIGAVIAASIAVPLCGMVLVPRRPQDPAYHCYADRRRSG